MSIIVTQIGKHGIIQVTDSAITVEQEDGLYTQYGRDAPKLFLAPHVNASVAFAGTYQIGGTGVNLWLDEIIRADEQKGNTSLNDFARFVAHCLERDLKQDEAYFFHITGYVQDNSSSHPEFYLVTNIHGLDKNGEYSRPTDKVGCTEDFWTTYQPRLNLLEQFEHGAHKIYCNGFTPGRQIFLVLEDQLSRIFYRAWSTSGWRLTAPRNLAEAERLLLARIELLKSLFTVSTYGAHVIGFELQSASIPSHTDS